MRPSGAHPDHEVTAPSLRLGLTLKAADEKKPAHCWAGFSLLRITSLTITYFHTGCSTIIGAKLFHGPVRDGKGWDQLAMVIRHNLY